jgi:hypothetical protein
VADIVVNQLSRFPLMMMGEQTVDEFGAAHCCVSRDIDSPYSDHVHWRHTGALHHQPHHRRSIMHHMQ